jgi:LysM repeat protein
MEACCTCAKILSSERGITAPATITSEKTPQAAGTAAAVWDEKAAGRPNRKLECCMRIICGTCLSVRSLSLRQHQSAAIQILTNPWVHQINRRFSNYCPYCQVSSGPSTLPDRLRDPPPYVSAVAHPRRLRAAEAEADAPPPYNAAPPTYPDDGEKGAQHASLDEKRADEPAPDTLHFLDHEHDTVSSLSLKYGVPASALRQANKLTSDHLLLARRVIVIPGEFYNRGISLSPRPVEGEEEEARKAKIRRLMVTCKLADYDVAVLYLEQADFDLDMAIEAYLADEQWEKEHPLEGTQRRRGSIGGRSGKKGGYVVREMGGTRASQAAFLKRP